MRRALATRDFAGVFTLLRRTGISQRAIAGLTGLAASEVYEITRGRKVMSYDVLVRLADGLGVPRGYLGLAYDAGTAALLSAQRAGSEPDSDVPAESSEARDLLEHAAGIAVGVTAPASDLQWTTTPDRNTPLPRRAGDRDVRQIEQITADLRRLDYRHGGGACREAVLAYSRWVRQLLHLAASDDVRVRLHLSLADLHNLAGWTSFDVGLRAEARRHFAIALTHAREAGEPSLIATVLYRIGRLYLHGRLVNEALRFFQLGQIAAQEGAGSTTLALLSANHAWAYGMIGNQEQALRSLDRAENELARRGQADEHPWLSFFGPTDLSGLAGMTHLELAGRETHLETARTALSAARADRGDAMPRSRAFELSGLAVVHARSGDLAAAIETGHAAVHLAEDLRSARVWDRLQPLADTIRDAGGADARDLRQLIRRRAG